MSATKGLVKSCPKLESGLRLGQEGIHACQIGPFSSPIFWTAEEAATMTITRSLIAEKRRWLFDLLNDEHAETACKACQYVCLKQPDDVRFDRLGHIDLAATTTCNLRCSFCGYSRNDSFAEAKYDALSILSQYRPEDVLWDSAVDFNGGEPTLLPDFDRYIEYFASRRIRVFLYTNAIVFRPSVYRGLKDGTIRWVCSSLDAGTPSTYKRLKQSTRFADVVENLSRYAEAGRRGSGQLAIKYIYHQGDSGDNCGDDDIAGFSEAVLAIRPQAVWLTFDFDPLCSLPGDSADFGGYDYSNHIAAYAKTYVGLKRQGFEAEHFAQRHLAVFSQHGRELLRLSLLEIERLEIGAFHDKQQPAIDGFRNSEKLIPKEFALFSVSPLRVRHAGQDWQAWSLAGKRVALAPACAASRALLGHIELRDAHFVGFLDRDPVLHGKNIDGVSIAPYSALESLAPDFTLIAAPEHHRMAIANVVLQQTGDPSRVVVWT